VAEVIARDLAPLLRLGEAELSGAGRGLAFQLIEQLGCAARGQLQGTVEALARADRAVLKRCGVRLGYADVFLPALLKPAPSATKARLRAAWEGWTEVPAPPADGRASFALAEGDSPEALAVYGYCVVGRRAVRVDMLDRLAGMARRAVRDGPFEPGHPMLSLVGCSREEMRFLLRHLGYRPQTEGEVTRYRFVGRPGPRPRRQAQYRLPPAHSPFAALAQIETLGRRRRER
jgi:ATP-dependent RNA helicase SUPV3L1/SUV3